MEKFTFTVSPEEAGLPLKKVIKSKYHLSSRLMTKIKYQDLLMLNGEKVPGYYTAEAGDTVTVSIPDEISHFEPEDIPIEVIYEDADLLVVNKQPYVTCHPTKGHPDHTMANGIMKYMQDTEQSFKIRFINRLDMDTSGVLLIGKNSFVQAELIKQMDHNQTTKKYIALVSGIIDEARLSELLALEGVSKVQAVDSDSVASQGLDKEPCSVASHEFDKEPVSLASHEFDKEPVSLASHEFLIDLAIGNPLEGEITRQVVLNEEIERLRLLNPNADHIEGVYPSKTIVRILRTFPSAGTVAINTGNISDAETNTGSRSNTRNGATLIEVELLTGRTHQIRVHMSHLGHPLIGDPLYGRPSGNQSNEESSYSPAGHQSNDETTCSPAGHQSNEESTCSSAGAQLLDFPRQALHAKSFSCTHPITKERLTFEALLPDDIQSLIQKLDS